MSIYWLFLAGAVIAEVVMVVCTRASEGWARLWPTAAMIGAAFVGMFCLARATVKGGLPISVAYAVWTGLGGVGAALVGMYWYKEGVSAAKLAFIGCIMVGVIGLKLVGGQDGEKDATDKGVVAGEGDGQGAHAQTHEGVVGDPAGGGSVKHP